MLYDLNGARADFLLYDAELDHALKRLTSDQVRRIETFLNQEIDGKESVNSSQIGAKWSGTPLEALKESDPLVYGKVFGAFLWRVFVKRPERWFYKKRDDQKEISGMDYFRWRTG